MQKTPLPVEAHLAQTTRWPAAGPHILAHHDAESVVVYQAYRPEIGEWAVRHGRLAATRPEAWRGLNLLGFALMVARERLLDGQGEGATR